MTLLFCDVAVGERFEFRGRRYKKIALSMASDEQEMGCVFMGETVVEVETTTNDGPRTTDDGQTSNAEHRTPNS